MPPATLKWNRRLEKLKIEVCLARTMDHATSYIVTELSFRQHVKNIVCPNKAHKQQTTCELKGVR